MARARNEYTEGLRGFGEMTRGVLGALCMSFALRLCDGDWEEANDFIMSEWEVLCANGIVAEPPPMSMKPIKMKGRMK